MAITSGVANSQATVINKPRVSPASLKVSPIAKAKSTMKSSLLITAKQRAAKKNKKKSLKVDSAANMLQADNPDPKTSIEGYLRIGKRQYT